MGIFNELTDATIYFSKLQNTVVCDEKGIVLGHLNDLFVDYEEMYPQVIAINFKIKNNHYYFDWQDIISFSYKKIVVKNNIKPRRGRNFPKVCNTKIITGLLANQFSQSTMEYPPIGKVILDRQIVDTHGKKVVRVNDIHFLRVGSILRVTHASIGLKSMLRRLGYDTFIYGIVKNLSPNSNFLKNEKIISWKFVHAVPDKNFQKNVKLGLTGEDINNLHPADIADILEELDSHGREAILQHLDPELAAQALSEVDTDLQRSFFDHKDPKEIAEIIQNLGPDEAADLLNELDEEAVEEIISNMSDDEAQEEIQELLDYEEDTAGGLMSTEVFQVPANLTKNEILEMIKIKNNEFESVYDIFIVDNHEKLIGTCQLHTLLCQHENVQIGDIMNKEDIKQLSPDTNWKDIAIFMSKYNLINVPITEEDGQLIGLVSIDDVLPWLLDE